MRLRLLRWQNHCLSSQVWIISCLGFVFITILEYFILLYYNRYIKPFATDGNNAVADTPAVRKFTVTQAYRVRPATHKGGSAAAAYARSYEEPDNEDEDAEARRSGKRSKKGVVINVDAVDKALLMVVPPVFVLFNFVYWYVALI